MDSARSLLDLAAKLGEKPENAEIIKQRILRGESPKTQISRHNNGFSLLHLAILHGNWGLVEFLLANKEIDLRGKNDLGNTPFHQAVILAAQKGDFRPLLMLVACDIEIDKDGEPLIKSTEIKNLKGKTPLQLLEDSMIGLPDGDIKEKCRVVIDSQILDPSIDAKTRRKRATDPEIYPYNKFGFSPLHSAILHANYDLLGFLLKKEWVDLRAINDSGDAPFHQAVMLAIEKGDFRALLMLAACDIDINKNGEPLIKNTEIQNSEGKTPLQLLIKGLRDLPDGSIKTKCRAIINKGLLNPSINAKTRRKIVTDLGIYPDDQNLRRFIAVVRLKSNVEEAQHLEQPAEQSVASEVASENDIRVITGEVEEVLEEEKVKRQSASAQPASAQSADAQPAPAKSADAQPAPTKSAQGNTFLAKETQGKQTKPKKPSETMNPKDTDTLGNQDKTTVHKKF